MGQWLATGLDEFNNPLTSPRTDRPATFDPLYGWPTGRKPREMKVTVEEMNRVAMDVGLRDYCAHTAIAVMECRHKYAPFASHPCYAKYHKWMDCQMKDQIIRMKEYERERRLLKRKRRKELAAAKESV